MSERRQHFTSVSSLALHRGSPHLRNPHLARVAMAYVAHHLNISVVNKGPTP